jgi:hypothetical protein
MKGKTTFLSGLSHPSMRTTSAHKGADYFLTGADLLKTYDKQTISIDQHIAQTLGQDTRFQSLVLSSFGGVNRPYRSSTLSFDRAGRPIPALNNPKEIFRRMFGQTTEAERNALASRGSILDEILGEAKDLNRRLGVQDQRKMDEYLASVREVEKMTERAVQWQNTPKPKADPKELDLDAAVTSPREYLTVMYDLMALAFQTDTTRVASFMLANAGSNLSYRPIGVSDGHHALSHHQGDPEKLDKISRINRFHVQQFSYVLQRLKAIPEGNGTLLDNCMIVYGSGISDGNKHNNENLPVLVAGGGQGSLLTGRHVRVPQETPMCNLFLSLLQRAGVPASSFGDSTGTLRGLEG